MCKEFVVIGLSDSRRVALPAGALEAVRRSRVFSGGVRHHEIVASLLPEGSEWIDVKVPLKDVFACYEAHERITVFASGDPLFFGFASTLRREFPEAAITVFPAMNSLQTLAHRMVLPYEEMCCRSVTGRDWKGLDDALIAGERLLGVLTDRRKTPAAIADRMLRYGYNNYEITVGEHLGNEEKERIATMSLPEAATRDFEFPNCVILRRTSARDIPFGLPESEFSLLDGRVNMITKMPVRLLALAMLGLESKTCMWDVGFCTGSVSIEARRLFPHLRIVAFERREEGRELMQANCEKFGTPGIEAVIGDFMTEDITGFPRPDAVFIGGHGGRLPEMMKKIAGVLAPGGCVVFNSVSDGSCAAFRAGATEAGMEITAVHRMALDSFNPIQIMKAEWKH